MHWRTLWASMHTSALLWSPHGVEVLDTGAGVTLSAPLPCEQQSSRSSLFFTSHLSQTPKLHFLQQVPTNSVLTLFSKRTMQLLGFHLGDFRSLPNSKTAKLQSPPLHSSHPTRPTATNEVAGTRSDLQQDRTSEF